MHKGDSAHMTEGGGPVKKECLLPTCLLGFPTSGPPSNLTYIGRVLCVFSDINCSPTSSLRRKTIRNESHHKHNPRTNKYSNMASTKLNTTHWPLNVKDDGQYRKMNCNPSNNLKFKPGNLRTDQCLPFSFHNAFFYNSSPNNKKLSVRVKKAYTN